MKVKVYFNNEYVVNMYVEVSERLAAVDKYIFVIKYLTNVFSITRMINEVTKVELA